jgi:hypothetical protein
MLVEPPISEDEGIITKKNLTFVLTWRMPPSAQPTYSLHTNPVKAILGTDPMNDL